MANPEHLEILKQGVEAWNQWREEHPEEKPDLSEARLDTNELSGINLSDAVLYQTDLSRAILEEADLSGADLRRADLRFTSFVEADLSNADLREADLTKAFFWTSDLSAADLRDANLYVASFYECELDEADLSGAFLVATNFMNVRLSGADVSGSNLTGASLVEAEVTGADFANSRVYGLSSWGLAGEPRSQCDLVITPANEEEITVDNLEVAQFVYLLLNNRKIRDVIDTVTSKSVLILGRFTDKRKTILDAIRQELRKKNLVPVMFDWPKSEHRDLTETVQLLANMARFVVADVTEAKSIPQELSHIIPNFPSVPVQPIILASQREYAMFEHWRKFDSVLPEFRYENETHLLANLEGGVIGAVEKWEEETDKAAAKERLMREKVESQQAEIARLKALVERTD